MKNTHQFNMLTGRSVFSLVSAVAALMGGPAHAQDKCLPLSDQAIQTVVTESGGEPLRVISGLIKQRACGVAMGDMHADLTLPMWMVANAPQIKALGIDVIRIEVNKDIQPIIDVLAKSDATPDQRIEARAQLAQTIHDLVPGMAQARVEMIDALAKAGIKVEAVDVTQEQYNQVLTQTPDMQATRAIWKDAIIAENIEASPHKGPYILFVGIDHTYKANPPQEDGKFFDGAAPVDRCPDASEYYIAPNHMIGGIDRRLGIPSIDSNSCATGFNTSSYSMRYTTGIGADIVFDMPTHPLQGLGFTDSGFKSWRALLAKDVMSLQGVIYASNELSLPASKMVKSLLDLRDSLAEKPGNLAQRLPEIKDAEQAYTELAIAVAENSEPARQSNIDRGTLHAINLHLTQMSRFAARMQQGAPMPPDRLATVMDKWLLSDDRLGGGPKTDFMITRLKSQIATVIAAHELPVVAAVSESSNYGKITRHGPVMPTRFEAAP
jgi:hypothetical protein